MTAQTGASERFEPEVANPGDGSAKAAVEHPPLGESDPEPAGEQLVLNVEEPLTQEEIDAEIRTNRAKRVDDDQFLTAMFGQDAVVVRRSYDDLEAEVSRRLDLLERSSSIVATSEERAGDRFAGSYFDRDMGQVVVQVTDPRSLAAAGLGDGVRVEVVRYSKAELERVMASVEAAIAPGGAIQMTGIDYHANVVMVGVLEGTRNAVSAEEFGATSDQIRVMEMSEAREEHNNPGEAGEKLPQVWPTGQTLGHCSSAGSAASYWAGYIFYYWLTAGHCRTGSAQAPNAMRFQQPGGSLYNLWQWVDSGCCDVGKVWVQDVDTHSRITSSSVAADTFAHSRIKGYNRVGDLQFSPVCFSGHGESPVSYVPPHRCGVTICASCTAQSTTLMTNQFWWQPNNCGFTIGGDSGGALYANYLNGVDLISIHQGSYTFPGNSCGPTGVTWSFGSRMDYSIPAIGVVLLTS